MWDLLIILVLLTLGYGFGSYREKKHYQSIYEREAELKDIMVFESRFCPQPQQHLGGELVHGNVVISTDYFKMLVAGLRKLVGGRLKTYESLFDRGRREAILRMKLSAQELGFDQIFNVRFETSSISKGARNNIGSVEVYVYGSAVKASE
ncbi:MAG: YbjQ family protein [Akkermansiaceae bacterium]|jgi:uncharacterized protein YbjQ (UPF0145 family)|nr:YbjQ family protein [Akkermansiaceae bacterium]|tara:strand:- start:4230 stop:4679 length:450 start_codon:yes stop_codon:yes gene_type:complete